MEVSRRTPRAGRFSLGGYKEAQSRSLEASGESVNAFGRRLGIVPQRLLWWRSRLGRVTPSFVPVEVTGTNPAVVVVAEDGTRVEVSTADAASAEWVARVLRSLRGRSR